MSFADDIAEGLASIRDEAGVAVTFHTSHAKSVDVTAVPGTSQMQADSDQGVTHVSGSFDWIVEAADLVIGGLVVLPSRGNKITRTIGSKVHTYEVMDPPYSPCDAGHSHLRIHTKRTR